MVVRIDTSRDHDALAEKPETILYCYKDQERVAPESAWKQVANCEVFPFDRRRLTTDALLAQVTTTVRAAKSDFTAAGITDAPKPDDVWKRADGKYYRVVMVDILSWENEYRIHCMRYRG